MLAFIQAAALGGMAHLSQQCLLLEILAVLVSSGVEVWPWEGCTVAYLCAKLSMASLVRSSIGAVFDLMDMCDE